MSASEDIVEALDAAAHRLLRKIGEKDSMLPVVEEIKAFGEIVKWAEIRPSLIPKGDQSDAKFVNMKERFHADARAPRGRRANGQAAAQSRSASPAISLLGGIAEDDPRHETE